MLRLVGKVGIIHLHICTSAHLHILMFARARAYIFFNAEDAAGVDQALGEDPTDTSGDFAFWRYKERSSCKSHSSNEKKESRRCLRSEVEAAGLMVFMVHKGCLRVDRLVVGLVHGEGGFLTAHHFGFDVAGGEVGELLGEGGVVAAVVELSAAPAIVLAAVVVE